MSNHMRIYDAQSASLFFLMWAEIIAPGSSARLARRARSFTSLLAAREGSLVPSCAPADSRHSVMSNPRLLRKSGCQTDSLGTIAENWHVILSARLASHPWLMANPERIAPDLRQWLAVLHLWHLALSYGTPAILRTGLAESGE